MATVTPPVRKYNQAESRQRVYHPLERLRGYIRSYVTLEGAAVLALYLACWFWIGLALDYGFFKLFTIDWVQELNELGTAGMALRIGLLSVLCAGLLAVVAVKVILRLVREFRDTALALVLERRFPKLLGDRLITAVELADPKTAQQCGYSQAMIDHTIQDAAERVEQIPVGEVFNWKRLRRYGLLVGALTVGLYLLIGVLYCLGRWAPVLGDYAYQFNDVAAIWFERNILLSNTIWPRRAYLELLEFPESGELFVGRNTGSATLKVRAYKWMVADRQAYDGWRALKWDDLQAPLVAFAVPPLPAAWDGANGWTVDQIQQHFEKGEVRNALELDQLDALESLFKNLHELAQSPRVSRQLRELEIPETVVVYFKGKDSRSEMTLKRGDHNEFSGSYSDLKNSVRFTALAEDYYTPYKKITVEPPPTLVKLTRTEYEPAYIYYRAPLGGDLSFLKGKKQRNKDVPFSLTGETSAIKVPAGTDVELTAEIEKYREEKSDVMRELQEPIRILPRENKGKDSDRRAAGNDWARTAVTLDDDRRTFHVNFRNVTGRIDFDFEFTDDHHITGRRHVVIEAVDDEAPRVDVDVVEFIRKTNQGFMITPEAFIPFKGNITDDRGLSEVRYAYTIERAESQALTQARAAQVAHVIGEFAPLGPWPQLLTAPRDVWAVERMLVSTVPDDDKPAKYLPMKTFAQRVESLKSFRPENLTPDELKARLLEQPTKKYLPVKAHTVEPDRENFDLNDERLPRLKAIDEKEAQQRYQMRIWVEATDNNVERINGPQIAATKERFSFIVVSEAELLSTIFVEEEQLHVKLEAVFTDLKNSRLKLDELILPLGSESTTKEQMSGPMNLRSQELVDSIIKGEDITREVLIDYSRILKELIHNRVKSSDKTKEVELICKELDETLAKEFPEAQKAQKDFAEALKAATAKNDMKTAELARQRLAQLIERLEKILERMEALTTFQKVTVIAQEILRKQTELTQAFQDIEKRMIELILKGLEGID